MTRFTETEKMAVISAKAVSAINELSAGEAVRHFVASVRRRIAHRARRDAVTRELAGLSNRMLEDLGMSRGDIAPTAKLTADRAYPVSGSIFGDLSALADAAIVRPIATWLARRQAESHLRSLDDRLLADVGLTRGDIASVVKTVHRAQKRGDTGFHVVRPFQVYNRSRIAVKELAKFDDRMLDDMGFVRGDIDWVAEKLASRSVVANANRNAVQAA